jgi:hypothetical protein
MVRLSRKPRVKRDYDELKHSIIEEITEQSASERRTYNTQSANPLPRFFFEPARPESNEFLADMFTQMEVDSVGSVILVWIRLAMGVGALTLPYYVSTFGLVWGSLAILIAGLMTLDSYLNVIEAAEMTEKTDYPSLVSFLLGNVG